MEKIRSIVILELLGKPDNYVKESAEALVKNASQEKGIKIEKSKIADLKKLDNGLFSTFAEMELTADNILVLIDFMFRYMPAHVEVIEPANINFESFDLNSILNGLIIKLHRYDELTKVLSIEKSILIKQLTELKKKASGIMSGKLDMPPLEMKSKEDLEKESKKAENKKSKKKAK
jgi:hypothetical protein